MLNQMGYCPITGSKGKKVDGATVKSMLSISLGAVNDVQYYFCGDPNCDVVYFSETGEQLFLTRDVRELVYQKQSDNPDVLICYCFRHTQGEVKRELVETGISTIVDNINAGIQKGQCACDWRNPQGDCCLGNVRRVVKQFADTTSSSNSETKS